MPWKRWPEAFVFKGVQFGFLKKNELASAVAGNGAGVGETMGTISVIDAGGCDGVGRGGRGGVGGVVLGVSSVMLRAVADMV